MNLSLFRSSTYTTTWDITSVDGALAERCRTVKEQLRDVVGSDLLEPDNSFSARRSLDDRPFIESFFRTLGTRGLQRLSNTTGPSPKARIVKDPDAVAVASEFQYEYLEELLQCLICNYNATPHSGLGFRSPLQMLEYLANRGSLTERRVDPELVQGLLSYRKLCKVHGGAAEGREPYVNFAGARYGGPTLRDREDLVGTKIWAINHIEDDARVARCTTVSGKAIGICRAAPPWDKLPHTLAIRSSILSLVSKRRAFNLGSDAIRSFVAYVEAQDNKKLPVHPAYLEVRRVLSQQSQNFEGDRAAERAMRLLAGQANAAEHIGEGERNQSMAPLVPRAPASEKAPSEAAKSVVQPKAAVAAKHPLPARRLAAN